METQIEETQVAETPIEVEEIEEEKLEFGGWANQEACNVVQACYKHFSQYGDVMFPHVHVYLVCLEEEGIRLTGGSATEHGFIFNYPGIEFKAEIVPCEDDTAKLNLEFEYPGNNQDAIDAVTNISKELAKVILEHHKFDPEDVEETYNGESE